MGEAAAGFSGAAAGLACVLAGLAAAGLESGATFWLGGAVCAKAMPLAITHNRAIVLAFMASSTSS
jgi:hypothetical protein